MNVENHTTNPEGKSGSPVDNPRNTDDDKVAYSSYLKVLDEKKKLSAKHSEVLSRLGEYEARDKDLEEKKLLEEKKYSELIKSKDDELISLSTRLTSMEQEKADFTKMHAFLSGLGDSKLDPKYYSLVPLEQIGFTEDGTVDLESLNSTVNSFKTEHPRLLIAAKNPLPADKVGDSSGKKLSVSEWKKLGSSKEMMAKYGEVDFTKP